MGFYCLKRRSGQIKKFGELFSKVLIFFEILPENMYILIDFHLFTEIHKLFAIIDGIWTQNENFLNVEEPTIWNIEKAALRLFVIQNKTETLSQTER